MTHYGWRNEYFSAFPNAIAIKPVAGPDVTIIPWFNIFFFGFMVGAALFVRAMWRQFRERSIDPVIEDLGEGWDAAGDHLEDKRGRLSRWLGTWRKKS
jgi:hypothetical protein